MLSRLQPGDVGLAHTEHAGKLRLGELVLYAVADDPQGDLVGEMVPLPLLPVFWIVEVAGLQLRRREIPHFHHSPQIYHGWYRKVRLQCHDWNEVTFIRSRSIRRGVSEQSL